MIKVSRRIPVNEPGQPTLTRADVWQGLVMKADNALPFVPGMSHCEVLNRESDKVFVREIEFRGERCRERITLTPQERVKFERLDGSVLGTILNEIEEDADGLGLRFSFALSLAGSPGRQPCRGGIWQGRGEGLSESGRCDARRHPQDENRPRCVDQTLLRDRGRNGPRSLQGHAQQERAGDLRQLPGGRRARADRRRHRPVLVDDRRPQAQFHQPLG